MKKSLPNLRRLSAGVMLAAAAAPTFGLEACLPTCNTSDAKMFAIAGSGMATLSGDYISLSLAVPAGSPGFEIGIFDGDVGAGWDTVGAGVTPETAFVLYADPNADNAGTVEVARWTSAEMINNDWKSLPIINHPTAQSPSGNYFYRLEVRNLTPQVLALNAFKVRVGGGASLSMKPQAFSFIGSLWNLSDANTVYPTYPALTPTNYDGNWTFFVKVPGGATSFSVWDGDLDFGDYLLANLDTDDPDTPNDVLPTWASGTAAVIEGVAVGFNGSTGNPSDDFSSAIFRRSPNIQYSVCAPDKVTCYANTNPSGNSEWEQFKIDTVGPFDPTKMDHLAPAIPAGIWTVNLKGVDLSNLNAYRVSYEIIAQPECPPGDACDPVPQLFAYRVGDTIFYDVNRNGVQDSGDAGIGGVTVNLLDGNGNVIGTTTTDASGVYRFDVDAGIYTVAVAASNFSVGGPLAGLTPTVDYTSDNAGDNQRTQTVVNSNLLTYDFGYGDTGSLGDRVWLDGNGNGVQDNGESGVGGVTVTLIGSDGTTRATTTAGDGSYLFIGLKSGVQYTVKSTAPNGYVFTTTYSQDPANGSNSNANPANGNMGTYTLSLGQNLLTVDAGLVLKSSCDLSKAQTLTQGGWSNKAHAKLLAELYSKPGFSVVIGGATNSVTLTTAAAVQAFLPSGGTPRMLTGNVVNPGNIKNTLAGQTVTTTLNATYWSSLATAKLTSGPYAGKTVQEVINLANAALNSGGSSTLLSNLTGALDAINNNLDDGKCNKGFLTCGTNVSSLPVNNTDDSSKDDDDGKSKSGSGKDDDDGKSKSGSGKDDDDDKSKSGSGKDDDDDKSKSGSGKDDDDGKSKSGSGKDDDDGKSKSGSGKDDDDGKSKSGSGKSK